LIETVVNGILWIPGRDRFLPDSHIYLLGLPEARDYSIVDCGLMEMGSYKIEAIEQEGIKLEHVKRIIFTHTHIDHIGCVREFLDAIPGLEIWVHTEEARYLESGDDRIVFGNSMFESMIRGQYTVPENTFTLKVARRLEGGEQLNIGGMEFTVYHIPGHSAGSIGLYNKQHKAFLPGDTIYADGAIGRFDLHSADPEKMKASLKFIAGLDIDILLPCHNRIVKRKANPMIKNTVDQWLPLLS
jgi:hydroxyacylglutathione hydrolase